MAIKHLPAHPGKHPHTPAPGDFQLPSMGCYGYFLELHIVTSNLSIITVLFFSITNHWSDLVHQVCFLGKQIAFHWRGMEMFW